MSSVGKTPNEKMINSLMMERIARAHEHATNASPRPSAANQWLIGGLSIGALILFLGAIFFFLAAKQRSDLFTQKVINQLKDGCTVTGLWIIASTTLVVSTVLFIAAIYLWRAGKKRIQNYEATLFPKKGEQKTVHHCFSYGNFYNISLMHGDTLEPNDFDQILKVGEFSFEYRENRGFANGRRFFLVLKDQHSHLQCSVFLQLQELCLLKDYLEGKGFTFISTERTETIPLPQKAPESPDSKTDEEKILLGLKFKETTFEETWINSDLIPKSFIQNGWYFIGRSEAELSDPYFLDHVGFVTVTVRCNNKIYSRLIFKEDNKPLKDTVNDEVVSHLHNKKFKCGGALDFQVEEPPTVKFDLPGEYNDRMKAYRTLHRAIL